MFTENYARLLQVLALQSKKEGKTIVSAYKPTNPEVGQVWKKLDRQRQAQGILIYQNIRDVLDNIEDLKLDLKEIPNKGVWIWLKYASQELASFVPELDKDFMPNFKHVNLMIDVLNFSIGRGYYGYGDAGTGKTSTVSWLMAVLRQPIVHINCRSNIESEEFFLTQTAINGKWDLQLGPLLRAITMDVPIVIDELDLAPSELLPSLNNLIEGRKVVIPNFPQQMIKPMNCFKFFSFGNSLNDWEGGINYEGRNALDASFLDRMVIDYYEQLNSREVKKILFKKYKNLIEEPILDSLVDFYKRVREKGKSLSLRSILTISDLYLANKDYMKHPMAYAIGSIFNEKDMETITLLYSMAFKLNKEANVNEIFKERFSLIDAKPKKAKKEKEPEEEIKNAS